MLRSKPLWEPASAQRLFVQGWGSHQNFRLSRSRTNLTHWFAQIVMGGSRVFFKEGVS